MPKFPALKALDLFCGLGGWSDGLAAEGFDVLGVEIEPKIASLYKHECIIADVSTLDGSRFKNFDLIVGSPPCREFSTIQETLWKRKKDPERGLILVNHFMRIVKEAEPRFWLMENNPSLEKWIGPPRVKSWLGINRMRRAFWGTFPSFFIIRSPRTRISGRGNFTTGLRKWERAIIPLPISRALGKAVRNSVEMI